MKILRKSDTAPNEIFTLHLFLERPKHCKHVTQPHQTLRDRRGQALASQISEA